jgi:hypothetical protein
MGRATEEPARASISACPHCGRETKTTSDGICADCWGSKGGHPMGWERRPPGRYGWGDDGLLAAFFGLNPWPW